MLVSVGADPGAVGKDLYRTHYGIFDETSIAVTIRLILRYPLS